MRIGIDIDDTITDTWEYMRKYHAKEFNVSEEELIDKPYYTNFVNSFSLDEYFDRIRPYYAKYQDNIPIKKDVKKVLDRLIQDGHEIIFITARGRVHPDAFNDSVRYLNNYNINYNKLITNSWDKADVCSKEHIDLFIDDSIKHCKAVSEEGIKVLMFTNPHNENNDNFQHVSSWQEIYKYIQSR